MNSQNNPDRPQYRYLKFGLLVTGETEERHLPKLFKSLMQSGVCTFKVLARVPQRTLFAWCWYCMGYPATDKYQLVDGKLSEIAASQLEGIS